MNNSELPIPSKDVPERGSAEHIAQEKEFWDGEVEFFEQRAAQNAKDVLRDEPSERYRVVHELKVWPAFFCAITEGRKTYEIRKNDRGFREGDLLILKEYDPSHGYTGKVAEAKVVYMTDGGNWGIPEDSCVLGIRLLPKLSPVPPSPKCGKFAGSLNPRLGLNYACVLDTGHDGDCQRGGTCFKHGPYVGDNCAEWPNCIAPSAEEASIAEHAWNAAIKSLAPVEATGVSAFFGKWPGDETDKELLSALDEVRKPEATESETPTERIATLEAAIRWALGESEGFPPRLPTAGPYWWRTELRERAKLSPPSETKGTK